MSVSEQEAIRDSIPKPTVRQEIAQKAARLLTEFDERIKQVVLFGADDGEIEYSDIDICVVVEGDKEAFLFKLISKASDKLWSNGFKIGSEPYNLHVFYLDEESYLGNVDESDLDDNHRKMQQKIRQGLPLLTRQE